jgi:hypothetical protein
MEHPEFNMTNENEQLILICRLPAGRSRPHPANSGCVRMPCAIRERVGQGGGGGLWEVLVRRRRQGARCVCVCVCVCARSCGCVTARVAARLGAGLHGNFRS